MSVLEELKIPRYFKPKEFGQVKSGELHHFSNASQSGYGQCSYVPLVNQQDQSHVSFAMGKTRVASLKSVTIPRLELTAAVVSTPGGVLGISSDGDDRMEPKVKTQKNPLGFQQNPKKSLDQKLTPKKIPCRFCGP